MADTKVNPLLVSNQALQQLQEPTISNQETTGTILYANDYSGVANVPMPDEWRSALNNDYGETGNNVIVQLQQKIQQISDGPWYVDSRDGVIYIHNRKFQEPSVAEYTYQSEYGEVLQVSFETRYVKNQVRASTSTGIDPNKGFNSSTISIDQDSYLNYYDPVTKNYKPNSAIQAFERGDLSYQALLLMNERIKKDRNVGTAFTKRQWDRIRVKNYENWQKRRGEIYRETEKHWQEYQANSTAERDEIEYERGIRETLQNKNLEENVKEFLIANYGTEIGTKTQAELEQAAQDGTLDGILKSRFSGVNYTFKNVRNDKGATVEAYTTVKVDGYRIKAEDIDNNPAMRRLHNGGNGQLRAFMKTSVPATISGYRLLKAYYSRKYNLSPGLTMGEDIDQELSKKILGSVNQSRKITERKLMAKATLIGRPNLKSSQVITLHNVGNRWSGAWYIKTCIHKISGSSGYTTEVDLIKHNSVEGYTAVSQQGSTGRDTSKSNTGGTPTNRPLTSMKLTYDESTYFNGTSLTNKEDLIILKMAGEEEVVSRSGSVGDLTKTQNVSLYLRRVPTMAERKKYGRAASKAVAAGIKSKSKK